jgi:hypothetical protein
MELGEAYYRDVILQMQAEFKRSIEAFELQVTCLKKHNELLEETQVEQLK